MFFFNVNLGPGTFPDWLVDLVSQGPLLEKTHKSHKIISGSPQIGMEN